MVGRSSSVLSLSLHKADTICSAVNALWLPLVLRKQRSKFLLLAACNYCTQSSEVHTFKNKMTRADSNCLSLLTTAVDNKLSALNYERLLSWNKYAWTLGAVDLFCWMIVRIGFTLYSVVFIWQHQLKIGEKLRESEAAGIRLLADWEAEPNIL